MTDSPLDLAHAAMEADPADDAARLVFFSVLADSDLFLLLAGEAEGEAITPELFDLEGGRYALVFDSEDRLAAFTERPAPYAGLPGRALARMLNGQGVGLALNLDVAPSAMLIPPAAVTWLTETLSHAPQETSARLVAIDTPRDLPEAIAATLSRKLAGTGAMAETAYLARATYEGDSLGHVLVFVGAMPGAEPALAGAASEALTFSGIEAGVMDVLFCGADDPLAERLARVGLRFDLPKPAERKAPAAPGGDPARPPRLR